MKLLALLPVLMLTVAGCNSYEFRASPANAPAAAPKANVPAATPGDIDTTQPRKVPEGFEACVRTAASNAGIGAKEGWLTRTEQVWADSKPELDRRAREVLKTQGLTGEVDLTDDALWAWVAIGAAQANTAPSKTLGLLVAVASEDWATTARNMLLLYLPLGVEADAANYLRDRATRDKER
jgi:hypothetical protein